MPDARRPDACLRHPGSPMEGSHSFTSLRIGAAAERLRYHSPCSRRSSFGTSRPTRSSLSDSSLLIASTRIPPRVKLLRQRLRGNADLTLCSILIRHQTPGHDVLASTWNADPGGAYMEAQAIRLLVRGELNDDDVRLGLEAAQA